MTTLFLQVFLGLKLREKQLIDLGLKPIKLAFR
jgi:hypothetical protein